MAVPTHPTIEHRNGSSPAPPATLQLHLPVEQNGLQEARSFDDLFRAYYTRLCAYAGSLVKRSDIAEEVVADVFVRLWEHRATWLSCKNQKGYLYAAVRNQALKHLAHERVVRKTQDMVLCDGYSPGMSQNQAPADELLNAKELAAAINCAVHKLPARCREAYLHRREGMSYAEIATTMGTSVRTVETQLARAYKALRSVHAASVL